MLRKLLTIAIMLAAVSAAKCKKDVYDPGIIRDYPQGSSAKGVEVYSASAVSPATRDAIDAGLDVTFAAAEREYPGKKFSRHDRYRVALYSANPKCEEKAFIIHYKVHGQLSDPYDQSEYDKNRTKGIVELCVVGRMGMHVTLDGVRKFRLDVVDHESMTQRAVQYEAEHATLLELDLDRYGRTQYHTSGNGHPIYSGTSMLEQLERRGGDFGGAGSGGDWISVFYKIPEDAVIPAEYAEDIRAGDEMWFLLVK